MDESEGYKKHVSLAELSDEELSELQHTEELKDITLDSSLSQKILHHYVPPEGFNKVGFARPLGGLFYIYFYAVIGGIVILLTFSILLKALYPFPDSKGYASLGGILFAFLFFITDIPTSFSLQRFVAEWRVKDPRKMLHYIRFYCWFQMLTGIVLVTATSYYVLFVLERPDLVFTKFMLLVLISRQYPAMLGAFKSALQGLQQFHKEAKINFISDTFIKPVCEYTFVLLGRYYFGKNPEIGPLMGISIGFAIGTYVDDFISMCISGYYLHGILDNYGYTLRDAIIPKIDRDVLKNSIIFGLKLSPPGFLGSILGFFTFFWWYDQVPAYATLIVLNATADQLGNLVRRAGGIYMKPVISESLNNGKGRLTQYYVAMTIKFICMMMIGMAVILLSFLPIVLEVLLVEGGAENWVLAAAFVVPNILASTLEPFRSTTGDVILGGNKPGFFSMLDISQTVLNFVIDYLFLFVWFIPQNMGIAGLIWFIPCKGNICLKLILKLLHGKA